MKKITLKLQEEKITLEYLNSFENTYNFNIPNSYKEFLVENNGGIPVEKIFWDGEIECYVPHFYSLKNGEYPIEEIIKELHREDALPTYFFPFASTGGAGSYAFSMKNEDFGAVYVFHFDGSEPLKLTDSFEDFINAMEE